MPEHRQVVFTDVNTVALEAYTPPSDPLPADQVEGRTLYSTVSSGTELAVLQGHLGRHYPAAPGYAAILKLTAVGADVTSLKPGDIVFGMAGHRSLSRLPAAEAVPVPEGLPLEQAGLARLIGVTMSTLVTTTARPPDKVLVCGLGIVGLLGAQVFQAAQYEVIACDPDERRQDLARQCGLRRVSAAPPLDDPTLAGHVALALECSGHEAATLAAVQMVRKRGEVVLVGVPWVRRTELSAFDLCHAVFHKYAVLRSGWEWEVPRHEAEFRVGSQFANFAQALQWLADGTVRADGLVEVFAPADAARAYRGLLDHTLDRLAVVFDWTEEA
ncbi:MAG: zinc-binding alcohol dehydrogenase [Armatimonadetes bacterium]|nr:zinc-binding alcohol dehydrogenase [Armatimonadota bacterium]